LRRILKDEKDNAQTDKSGKKSSLTNLQEEKDTMCSIN
jgi:hypothetical protein